jgi:hypothetical protein
VCLHLALKRFAQSLLQDLHVGADCFDIAQKYLDTLLFFGQIFQEFLQLFQFLHLHSPKTPDVRAGAGDPYSLGLALTPF